MNNLCQPDVAYGSIANILIYTSLPVEHDMEKK